MIKQEFVKIVVLYLLLISGRTVFADNTNTPPTHFQIETLKSILADADQAAAHNDPASRAKYLREFLAKSKEVGDISTFTNIWILRAAAALEVNDDQSAVEAGQMLVGFHLNNSDSPNIQKIMIVFNRKNLLEAINPQVTNLIGTWKIFPTQNPYSQDCFGVTGWAPPLYSSCEAAGSIIINASSNNDLTSTGNFSCTYTEYPQMWSTTGAIQSIKIEKPGYRSDFCPGGAKASLVGDFTFNWGTPLLDATNALLQHLVTQDGQNVIYIEATNSWGFGPTLFFKKVSDQ